MDSTPPPEMIVPLVKAAPLDAGFLAALRVGTFQDGVFRAGDRRLMALCIDAEGLWNLISPGREGAYALTAGMWSVLSLGLLHPDGTIKLDDQRYQLCAVELADGTRLAVVVPG